MKNTVTQEQISELLNDSKVEVKTVFGKCTIVSVQLPNGFVITDSSACVDPANYNEKMGASICMDRIESKLWELEGYRLQQDLYDWNERENIKQLKIENELLTKRLRHLLESDYIRSFDEKRNGEYVRDIKDAGEVTGNTFITNYYYGNPEDRSIMVETSKDIADYNN